MLGHGHVKAGEEAHALKGGYGAGMRAQQPTARQACRWAQSHSRPPS